MSLQKERTADVAAPAIQQVMLYDTDSVLQFLLTVNDNPVTDPEQIEELCRERMGREDVTEEMRMFFIGKIYEAKKARVKALRQNVNKANDLYPCRKDGKHREIADYVAEELGIGSTTVKRHGFYTRGIEAVWKIYPDVAMQILKGERKVSGRKMVDIGIADDAAKKSMIDATILGKAVVHEPVVGRVKRRQEDLSRIAECVESLFGSSEERYGIKAFVRDIRMNSEPFINMLSQLVEQNKDLCAKHKNEVMQALIESVIYKIEEIEEEIKHYE